MNAAIARRRLLNQGLARSLESTPEDVVARLGAVQAQEYAYARWGLGLRLPPGATDAAIARAVDEGRILRTHVMRPTWHFVAAADIHWLLALTAPRVHRTLASYTRNHGLDAKAMTRATAIVEKALAGGRHLTRAELGAALARARMKLPALPLAFVTMYAELEGVVCSGAFRGKAPTYALLSERAPKPRPLDRDEALAELARRFFGSHGPATLRDFSWWSGLTIAEGRRGVEAIGARALAADGLTYWTINDALPAGRATRAAVLLLPIYDEYVVAYRDRAAVPHGPGVVRSGGRAVIFQHALVIDGQIAGTWRVVRAGAQPAIDVTPLRRLTEPERRGVENAAARYRAFVAAR